MKRSRWVVVLLLAFALVASQVGAADDSDGKAARTLYNRGMAHFRLAEYDQAIELWQEGFRRKPVSELLYNIAQAHRLANRPEQALANYRQYLSMNPKASNRPEVERHITNLTATIEEQKIAAAAAAAKPPEPAPPEPVAQAPAPVVDNQIVARPPARKPLYKKGWFWGAIVGGVVVVAGAVTLGVVLGGRTTHRTVDDVVFP